MGAPIGNNNAEKFQTPEERQKLALDYHEHCRQGLSDQAFYIDEGTLHRYEEEYPIDFGTIKESRRLRRVFWEELGIRGSQGAIKGFNAVTWIFNMKNRFGWGDRDNKDAEINDGKMDMVTFMRLIQERDETNVE